MLDINGSLFDNSDVFYVDCSQLVLNALCVYEREIVVDKFNRFCIEILKFLKKGLKLCKILNLSV